MSIRLWSWQTFDLLFDNDPRTYSLLGNFKRREKNNLALLT